MMNDEFEYGSCEMCGRSDVPICPKCHHRAPHGMTQELGCLVGVEAWGQLV